CPHHSAISPFSPMTAPPSLVVKTALRGIFMDVRKSQIGSGRHRPLIDWISLPVRGRPENRAKPPAAPRRYRRGDAPGTGTYCAGDERTHRGVTRPNRTPCPCVLPDQPRTASAASAAGRSDGSRGHVLSPATPVRHATASPSRLYARPRQSRERSVASPVPPPSPPCRTRTIQ